MKISKYLEAVYEIKMGSISCINNYFVFDEF